MEGLSHLTALDADHLGRTRDGRVVEPGRAARPQAPLGAQSLEQAEGRPGIWPDLYLLDFDVIQGQSQESQLLGGRPLLVQGPRRRLQFPRRAGL